MNHRGPIDPEWLAQEYDIRWNGRLEPLGGKLASVFLVRDEATGERLVIRLSDPSRISESRLVRVHRFMAHLSKKGIYIPLPLIARDGRTIGLLEQRGDIVEVFPYVDGRGPCPGDAEDATRVASSLAAFHSAGLDYDDLPGEESCDQNHVALERLRHDAREARVASVGKSFEPLLSEYLEGADQLIDQLQTLRPRLVKTGLNLDVSRGNVIFGGDGGTWFIDCNHAAWGRRVFDVATAVYYMDRSSQQPIGDLRRYEDIDPEFESAFLDSYRAACVPSWQEAEDLTYALEHRLMLVHGAVYWVRALPTADLERELEGFRVLNMKRSTRTP
jgi:Ser/Thr protein kinase RdoA (MazF antagonist)